MIALKVSLVLSLLVAPTAWPQCAESDPTNPQLQGRTYERCFVEGVQSQTNDRAAEADRWYQLGKAASDKDDYFHAIEYYRKAVDLNVGRVVYVTDLTSLYRITEKYSEAQKLLDEQVRKPWKPDEQKDLQIWLADIHFFWAKSLMNTRDYQQAAQHFQAALEIDKIYRGGAPPESVVWTRRDIISDLEALGAAYGWLNQYDQAIESYEQGLATAREMKDRGSESEILKRLGGIYSFLSQSEKAFEYYNRALKITRETKDRSQEASVLSSLGSAYEGLSRYGEAIESYEQALKIARNTNEREEEGTVLNHLGSLYRTLGQRDKAIEYYELALRIKRERDREGEGAVINNLGMIYQELGQYQKAIEYYEHALDINRELKDREGEGTTLNNLGGTSDSLHQYEKAVTYYEQALEIAREVKDKSGEGTALNNLGLAFYSLHQYDKSISSYEQALAIIREVKDRSGESSVLGNLMQYWYALQKPRLAIFYGKQAVNTIQELRANLRGLDRGLQRSFLHSNEDTYRYLAGILISQGRLPEAQQVLRLLKEEEFSQYMRGQPSSSTDPIDKTATEAEWEQRYLKIADQVAAIGYEYGELRERSKKSTLSPSEAQRQKQLEHELEDANAAFHKFLAQLYEEFGKAVGSEKVSKIKAHENLKSALGELGQGAVALYTIVGEDKYRVILITPETEVAREYPIKRDELNKLIAEFRDVFDQAPTKSVEKDPLPLAQKLYKIVVGPIAEDLKQVHASTLMWSLDGTLRYLPIAALHDGEKYMVEKYRNEVFTLSSLLNLKDSPAGPSRRGLGLGVSEAHPPFKGLPAVPDELRGIIRKESVTAGETGILPGERMLDKEFTLEAMKDALRSNKYQVVHIASHFTFKPNKAESFLLLGDNNHFTLDQIDKSTQLFNQVEVLTLSACETAVGSTESEGEEVESFGELAQLKGAKAIVASLWPVADRSTKDLMEEFYRNLVSQKAMTKAEALQQAQLKLLHSENYHHPYFWAPFILIGNWK
jgi:CHAT domain-containing protein/tetratricopeptide (TPR) repeat protein